VRWHARSRSYRPPTRKSLRKSQRLPRSAPPLCVSRRPPRSRPRGRQYRRAYCLTH